MTSSHNATRSPNNTGFLNITRSGKGIGSFNPIGSLDGIGSLDKIGSDIVNGIGSSSEIGKGRGSMIGSSRSTSLTALASSAAWTILETGPHDRELGPRIDKGEPTSFNQELCQARQDRERNYCKTKLT
jgi:hypothetical protein